MPANSESRVNQFWITSSTARSLAQPRPAARRRRSGSDSPVAIAVPAAVLLDDEGDEGHPDEKRDEECHPEARTGGEIGQKTARVVSPAMASSPGPSAVRSRPSRIEMNVGPCALGEVDLPCEAMRNPPCPDHRHHIREGRRWCMLHHGEWPRDA